MKKPNDKDGRVDLKQQAKELRARIEAAFADVPYPGDANLGDGTQMDDDYDDMLEQLTGKHWRDLIPRRKPPQGRSNPLSHSMCFCSAAAWRFFLPAYLITDLMKGHISRFPLEPDRSERLSNHIEERFRLLNAEQCAVIASFLSYAEALLDEDQKKAPHRYTYFEGERPRLVALIAYWNARSAAVAARFKSG